MESGIDRLEPDPVMFLRNCLEVLASSSGDWPARWGPRNRISCPWANGCSSARAREDLADRAADLAGMTSGQAMNEVLRRLAGEWST